MRKEKGQGAHNKAELDIIESLKGKIDGIFFFFKITLIKDHCPKENTLILKGPIHTQGPKGTEDIFKES